jgi:serine/threonine protein kinase
MKGASLCQPQGQTRIASIIFGIVLAMRSIHSRRDIHRDLTLDNHLLDSDWNVRVGDFVHSFYSNVPVLPKSNDASPNQV